tara:strand:+ start:13978 stop:15171 length:1194 start_codon:yes stop_codon:yes gene_type:complete
MKRFQELRESVYSPNGVNVPDASDGMDAVGLYAIEQPEVLARINAVVQACFSGPCNDIQRKINELRSKLNIAGYDLDLTDFIAAEGEQKIPLNRFGGRSGWDMEKGAITKDDGIEPFAGHKMCLYITVSLDNYSFYRIEGYIAPSIEEEVPELGEAKDEFKPHMMYDPKTGKGYKAEKEADHLRMKKMGYTHEKPEVKEEYEEWYEAMRTVMVRTESLDEALKVNKKDGPFTVVALKGKKVVSQFRGAEHRELADVIKMMKAENKGAKISVEAKGGKVVHTESVELDEDRESAMELKIYIENDAQLYKSQMLSIFKNLMAKRARGQYQSKLASKLFMYLVDNGAKKYVKEHDAPGAKWNKVFDKATRQQVADNLTRDFEAEAESGAYDNFIPKKYQK